MDVLLTILAFLFILAIVIVAHELGHFITAKARGIKVEEFGIGYPPRLFGIKRGETVYSLNAIPLGGFTKMAGEEDPNVERSLASKGIGTRLLVLSAGSLMNAILPFVLLSIAFMVPHNVYIGDVVVQEVSTGSPAEEAGIMPGDIILTANGKAVNNTGDLSRYIQLNLGGELELLVEHNDGIQEEVVLSPRWRPPEGEGAIGAGVTTEDMVVESQSEPFWRAIPMGIGQTFDTMVLYKNAILSMFIGNADIGGVAGPVGIAQITGEVAKAGFSPLLEWTAFFSLNLAILNLLPLPALDGGRIAFVLLEWIRRGKRISPKKEGLVHLVGFALLMVFILAVTFQDIMRIISGESLI
ncbi:MAG TPA: site-2 protease family protein, partial [Dehalococcoidia bacterium]|nr:site-2 protease family protein [Dehalococcoidia bacterium]